MTSNAHQFPVPRRHQINVQPVTRSLALRPALALVASRALPAVTASVAAVATLLTAERAVRGVANKLTSAQPAALATTPDVVSKTRTVVTEWITVERRRRTR